MHSLCRVAEQRRAAGAACIRSTCIAGPDRTTSTDGEQSGERQLCAWHNPLPNAEGAAPAVCALADGGAAPGVRVATQRSPGAATYTGLHTTSANTLWQVEGGVAQQIRRWGCPLPEQGSGTSCSYHPWAALTQPHQRHEHPPTATAGGNRFALCSTSLRLVYAGAAQLCPEACGGCHTG